MPEVKELTQFMDEIQKEKSDLAKVMVSASHLDEVLLRVLTAFMV